MSAGGGITTSRRLSAAACYQAFLTTPKFACLDGLRFICIAAVLWHHSPIKPQFAEYDILGKGFLGVDFFFVLSGFLITTLLLREERKTGTFSIRKFYWRRILRIIPIYYLVVTFVVAITILKGQTAEALEKAPYYYLFLSNFLNDHLTNLSITWSLSVEEQFYLLWPALLMITPRRWLGPVLLTAIIINVIAVTGALAPLGVTPVPAGPMTLALPNATYAPILMGAGLALLLADERGFGVLHLMTGWIGAPVVYLLALPIVVYLVPSDLIGWPNLLIHIIMVLSLASIVVREANALTPVLTIWPIARIGQISYGAYLYHLFALHGAGIIASGNSALEMALYLVLTVLISEVSFRTVERFFLSFSARHRVVAAP